MEFYGFDMFDDGVLCDKKTGYLLEKLMDYMSVALIGLAEDLAHLFRT